MGAALVSRPFPVELEVVGLSGPLCHLTADSSWTIKEVKNAVAALTGVPGEAQILVQGTRLLANEADTLLELSEDSVTKSQSTLDDYGLRCSTLTLVRSEEKVTQHSLQVAVEGAEESLALTLLQLPQPHGLNESDSEGRSLLHKALLWDKTKVALALLERQDFVKVNDADLYGKTALHHAAERGRLDICQRLLGREDFWQAQARTWAGATAMDLAAQNGHLEVMLLLQDVTWPAPVQ